MKISHLLVCLDLSAYDKNCIKQSVLIASQLKSIETITYLHNIRYDFIDHLLNFDEKNITPLKEKIEEDIEHKINHYRSSINANIEISVSSLEHTVDAIRAKSHPNGTLTLMALKQKIDGKAIIPTKFLRFSASSPLLLIPKKRNLTFNNTAIASQKKTLKKYRTLFPLLEVFGDKLTWLKIIKTPITYFPYLNTDQIDYDLSKPIVDDDSLAQFSIDTVVIKAPNISKAILKYVTDRGCDLLVMSKTENTSLQNKFSINLGSNLQKVLQVNEDVTMLIL